jgi:hypothetical protein
MIIFIAINLRDMVPYQHEFSRKTYDYIAYGVKFENMRKVLTLRAPYIINNYTDSDYMIKLSNIESSTLSKTNDRIISLKSG